MDSSQIPKSITPLPHISLFVQSYVYRHHMFIEAITLFEHMCNGTGVTRVACGQETTTLPGHLVASRGSLQFDWNWKFYKGAKHLQLN